MRRREIKLSTKIVMALLIAMLFILLLIQKHDQQDQGEDYKLPIAISSIALTDSSDCCIWLSLPAAMPDIIVVTGLFELLKELTCSFNPSDVVLK